MIPFCSEIKKPVRRRALNNAPPLPCPTRSYEHVLLHVELARRLSIFGRNADMLATVCGSFRDRFIYGSRTVANHQQSRENWFSKDQTYLPHRSLSSGNFSRENLKFIFLFRRLMLAFANGRACNYGLGCCSGRKLIIRRRPLHPIFGESFPRRLRA